MVEVNLWSGLRALADGRESVEVEADTVGGVLRELVRAYPALQEPIDAGVSVSVNGRIIASDLTARVESDSEVFLLQRLRGG
ncbi:MAG TPA: hypothetical protein DEA05_12985 [Rhodobacteraceae bacterium]|nr:hypothetical protein [Paracoccaceae bacterium]